MSAQFFFDFPVLQSTSQDSFDVWMGNYYEKSGGIIVMNKPLHWTSFDIVAKVRGIAKEKKVGHAGTLDPLAVGVLVLGLGKATKIMSEIQNLRKKYSAEMTFGYTTISDDAETTPTFIANTANLHCTDIQKILPLFCGEIQQTPPAFSAVKVQGQPAYKAARKGLAVDVQSRIVHIYSLQINSYTTPVLSIDIECSKGTYIRSLARDIGSILGVGGFLSKLNRTAVGEFTVDNALSPEEVNICFSTYRSNLLQQNHEHV